MEKGRRTNESITHTHTHTLTHTHTVEHYTHNNTIQEYKSTFVCNDDQMLVYRLNMYMYIRGIQSTKRGREIEVEKC